MRFGYEYDVVCAPYAGKARTDVFVLGESGDDGGRASVCDCEVAFLERQCVAVVGDGGFSMLMAEFATAAKYRLPIKVVVIKNNSLGQI